jgi:D-alanine-D-alanine ligase-like ATP-grasp enzyme
VTIAERFPAIISDPPNTYDDSESQFLIAEQIERGRNIGTLVLARSAERDGASVRWFGGYTAIATKGSRQVLLRGHMCTDTATSGLLVKDKVLSKEIFLNAGVSTPRGGLVQTADEAIDMQRRLGCAVVVKPRFGGQGKGVTVNVETPSEITEAFLQANYRRRGVLVEEYIEGVEFRIVASPEGSFGAIRRLLPHVEGDGISTIHELIRAKNRVRRLNPNNCRLMIPVDNTTKRHLERLDLKLETVLPAGARVTVRNVGGISSGGDASECLDLLDPATKELASQAIAAVPTMDWGGADILVSNETGLGYVLELNTNAAISNSTFPVYGEPKDVGTSAWKRMLRRVPLDLEDARTASPTSDPVALSNFLSDKNGPSHKRLGKQLVTELSHYLENRGWQTERKSARIMRAHYPGAADKWFNGLMDERFPASVSSLLRRHHLVRQILRRAGIAMPRATDMSDPASVHEYWERSREDIALVPRDRGWSGRDLYQGSAAKSNLLSGESRVKVLAQQVVPGAHLQIFAARSRVMAIISADSKFTLTAEQIQHAGLVATNAVRAIPGLPWASVDVVIPASHHRPIMVEGMTVTPRASEFGYLCAGSVEALLEEIAGVELSRQVGAMPRVDGQPPKTSSMS